MVSKPIEHLKTKLGSSDNDATTSNSTVISICTKFISCTHRGACSCYVTNIITWAKIIWY